MRLLSPPPCPPCPPCDVSVLHCKVLPRLKSIGIPLKTPLRSQVAAVYICSHITAYGIKTRCLSRNCRPDKEGNSDLACGAGLNARSHCRQFQIVTANNFK